MHFECAALHSTGRMVFRFKACEQVCSFTCRPSEKTRVTHSIASDNLLLENRPLDEIRIQQTSNQGFVVSFDIPLWQRRIKVIGQVSIEFIASGKHISTLLCLVFSCTSGTGRMWSVIFFAADPSTIATCGKSRQGTNTWHVMVSLLESSPPTFFDSQLVVDVPPPFVPDSIQIPRVREVRSTTFPQSRSSMYEYNYDGKSHPQSSRGHNVFVPSSSSKLPPPTHPLRGSLSSPRSSAVKPPPISIRLGCGERKLSRRIESGEPPGMHLNSTDIPSGLELCAECIAKPTTKPDKWSDHGVGYTNAVVSPFGEGLASQLLYE